ncbi:hypothetical protein GCM10010112_40020 [Actinoplanes lobatus]|nr:hypothetical protein GCM10010112_40020 [Actinoplanes lobatus]
MAALVLLVVNDHVWKAVHPGWVTGKLSDVAGMVLAPPLLAAVTGLIAPRAKFRWVAPGAILTVGVGFAMVKTMGYAAALASDAWSLVTPSLVRVDPADLLALPFLGVAWWVARREPRPAPQWLKALRLAVFLPLALAGVAATSATPTPDAHSVVVDPDGALFLGADTLGDGEPWAVSRDGGRTFVPSAGPRAGRSPECTRTEPVVCYRVVDRRMAVENRTGTGPWREVWGLAPEQVDELEEAYPEPSDSTPLWSEQLAVLDVPGGHVVAVANGRDGFAVRDVSGSWRRIGLPTMADDPAPIELDELMARHQAADESGPKFLAFVLAWFLGGLVVTAAPVWRAHRTGVNPNLWWLLFAQLAFGGLVLFLTVVGVSGDDLSIGFAITGTLVMMVLVVVSWILAMVLARVPFLRAAGLTVLVVGAFVGAFLLWEATGAVRIDTAALILLATAAAVTPAAAKVV